jgi:hypothetical protein
MYRSTVVMLALLFSLATACSDRTQSGPEEAMSTPEAAVDTAAVDETRATAEAAYIFAYPMLEHYRTLAGLLHAEGTALYIGGFNVFDHGTQLLGPEATEIVRPNNDTLYSKAVLDLRAEPLVLSVPAVPDRYYSFQFIDLYTHNIGFVGTRATGSGPGSYLIAGPSWTGEPAPGIDGVIRSEGYIVVALARTAVADAADVANVKALQASYELTPLSAFLGQPPPPTQPDYEFPAFTQQQADAPEFVGYLAFLLDQMKVDDREGEMVTEFLALRDALDDAAIREAVQLGIDAGREKIEASISSLGEERNGWSLALGLFGDREAMQGRYLTRAAAAMFGLWGNDEAEAYYPTANADGNGEPLDGSRYRYKLHFERDQLPDVDGFWSITMYGLPRQLMVENPIERYSIGDRTKGLAYGEDGSLTLYLQPESPDAEKESNWLPAPKGPFSVTLRMYIPSAEALAGPYAPPPIERLD